MKHENFRELLTLFLYDDVSETERFAVEQHLQDCSSCRYEMQELQQLHTIIPRRSKKASEAQLNEARSSLHQALTAHKRQYIVRHWLPYASAAALFVIGIFSGYFASRFNQEPRNEIYPRAASNPFERGDVQISDIDFVDIDPKDGQVEFTFHATAPVHVKGSINDERVLSVLTKVLVNEQNPGARLRAVNALQSPQITKQDDEIKSALLAAVRMDENVAVRMEALNALRTLPFDQEIKQTLLRVLMYDRNSGVRVEAIKIIESAHQYDRETMEVFKKKMSADENNYVRTRARAIVEEVYEQ